MKRNWNNDREIENLAMANCLTLLNHQRSGSGGSGSGRVFHCKTCNKQFKSFQALGGHRTSHKRPKQTMEELTVKASKMHECSICGVEFELGQALGGHMRRHRDALAERKVAVAEEVVVDGGGGGRRRLCLDLDLNLTPFQNEVKIWRRSSGTAGIVI